MQKTTLYAALDNPGTLSEKPGSGAYRFPALVEGKDVTVGLRLTEKIDGTVSEVTREVTAIHVSLAAVDARPTSGSWKIQFGNPATTPVENVNLTIALDWDITAAELLDALKDLTALATAYPSFTTDGTVDLVNGSWLIGGLDDDAILTARANKLMPISEVFIEEYQGPDALWVHRIRHSQSPVAFTSTHEIQPRPVPTITQITPGTTDGDVQTPDIEELVIPAGFLGSMGIRRDDLGLETGPLSFVGDPASDLATLQSALNTKLLTAAEIAEEANQFTVYTSAKGALIVFSGASLIGVDQADILVPYVIAAAAGDLVFTLELNRPELRLLLDSKAAASPANEARLQLQIDADLVDVHDEEVDRLVTLYRGEVTVVRDIRREGVTTGEVISWSHQHTEDHIPAATAAILPGELSAKGAFGNGIATTFAIDHNLGSDDIKGVTVYTNTSPAIPLAEWKGNGTAESWAQYSWQVTNANRVTITMLGAYASTPPASDALKYIIDAAGEKSVFIDDLILPKERVTGLTDTLASLAAEIAALKLAIGTGATGATTQTEASTSWPLNTAFLTFRPQTLPADFEAPASLIAYDPAAAGLSYRSLMGAVGNTTPGNLTNPVPTANSTHTGNAYVAVTADLTFPGGGIRAGDFAIADGARGRWIRATRGWTDPGATITANATSDVLTSSGNLSTLGIGNGTAIAIVSSAGDPPAPLTVSDTAPQGSITPYYIRDVSADSLTFKLAATSGGSAIDLTDAGTGTHRYLILRDTYHPAEMEAELCNEIVLPEDLTLGSVASLQFGFEAAILYGPRRPRDRKTEARWRVVIESGVMVSASGNPAPNIASIAWTPMVVADIGLSPTPRPYRFGVTITRSSANALTATQTIGRSTSAAVAPNGGTGGVAFYLRARLAMFDTNDSAIEPAGLVLLRGLKVDLSGADDGDLGKLTIG